VLGWASSPEPAEPSLFKPKPSWALTRACTEKVGFINVDGAIGPATASYISRSIEEAKAQNVQCLVIQLNTPGGLLDSTQKIVQSFLGSPSSRCGLRRPHRRDRDQRRLFHHAGGQCRGNGAGHYDRRGASGFHRRFPSGGEEKPDENHEAEARKLFHQLHGDHCGQAPAQR